MQTSFPILDMSAVDMCWQKTEVPRPISMAHLDARQGTPTPRCLSLGNLSISEACSSALDAGEADTEVSSTHLSSPVRRLM